VKVLLAFIQLQDFTLTDVSFCLLRWQEYLAKNHPELKVDIVRFNQYPFERNFNEIVRYAINNDYDYLFQYDADMLGHPRIIPQLISHNKECVGAMFYSRNYPHYPQAWAIDRYDSGDCKSFYQLKPEYIAECIREGSLIASDVRSGGFTLFKVDALRPLSYPYAQFKPASKAFHVNGIDMDITAKLSKLYDKVYSDPDPTLQVKHITFKHVDETYGLPHQVLAGTA